MTHASVEVESEIVGAIGPGLLVLLGVTHTDREDQAIWLASKLVNLRIFEDADGKFSQSLLEKKGEALIVSQFTLYADCTQGRRPSFTQAAPAEIAKPLYEKFIQEVQKTGISVKTGVFGARMKISLLNDGPVTLLLDR